MQHKNDIIIKKVIREIDFAITRLDGMSLENFIEDVDAQHAVSMAVLNVGELIKHITKELRIDHPEIPWKQATGLRDIVAHTYETVQMEEIYETVKTDFPAFKDSLLQIKQ